MLACLMDPVNPAYPVKQANAGDFSFKLLFNFPIPSAFVLGSLVIGCLIAWRRAQSSDPEVGFWEWGWGPKMGPKIRSQKWRFWMVVVSMLVLLAVSILGIIGGIAAGHLFPFS